MSPTATEYQTKPVTTYGPKLSQLALVEAIRSITDVSVLRDLNRTCIERLQSLAREMVYDFSVGDTVEFTGRGGKVVRGVIERVNRSTVSVMPSDAYGRGWRVPASLLRRVKKEA